MKRIYKLLLPLISLMLIASCRENLTPIVPLDEPTAKDSTEVIDEKAKIIAEYVQIDYSADIASLKGDDARAGDLSFFLHKSNKDKEPIPMVEGDETKAHFIITNGSDKTIYQNITLKVEANELGELYLHYKGNLGLKNSEIGDSQWYITAIIGGEYDKKKKEFCYNPNKYFSTFWEGSGLSIGTEESGINIPLATKWEKLKLEAIANTEKKDEDSAPKSKDKNLAYQLKHQSTFKFFGHIIKLRVINNNIYKFHWEATHIKEVNYMSNVKLSANIEACTKANTYPKLSSNGALNQLLKFKNKKLIFENGDKSYILPIYICKRPRLSHLPTKLTIELRGQTNGIDVAMPFSVPVGKEGQVSYTELKLPKVETEIENMPLSYWNKSNCKLNGDLVEEKETGEKFYENQKVEDKLKEIFELRKSRIPSPIDWHTIFPFSTPGAYSTEYMLKFSRIFFDQNQKTDYQDYKLEEEVHIPKAGGGYTTKYPFIVWSHYRDVKQTKTIYGIRLTDKQNKYRSAWRYQYLNNGIKVSSLYLGPARQLSLDDISNNDFWERARLEGRTIVERFFPEFPINGTSHHTYYRTEVKENSSHRSTSKYIKYFVMAFSRKYEDLRMLIVYRTSKYDQRHQHYALRLIRTESLEQISKDGNN